MSELESESDGRPRRVLVTGGSRSGKSRHAEALLAGEPRVIYVAPGSTPDRAADPEWADRIELHRARRPSHWSTVETLDLAGVLESAEDAVLVDDLGSWLTATIDRLGTWEQPLARWRPRVEPEIAALVEAWRTTRVPVVAVTSEVGWGLVSEHRSGRTFADLLGEINERLARHADDVILVVAGRILRL